MLNPTDSIVRPIGRGWRRIESRARERAPNLRKFTMTTISYDPSGVFLPEYGISQADLAKLLPRLTAARDEVLADVELWSSGRDVPKEKQPLDAGFFGMPDRLLSELQQRGGESELARVRAAADQLAGKVDSVVVLGIGGSYMGARAILEAL